MSIRESAEKIVSERALEPAAKVFELDHDKISTFEKWAAPLAPVGGQIADFVTTTVAIHRGATEANPAMKSIVKNAPLFLIVKLGVGAFMATKIKKLEDNGEKKAARVVSIVGTLIGAGPAISNIYQMNKG